MKRERFAKKAKGKLRKIQKLLPDHHELALDKTVKRFAKQYGLSVKEIEKNYSERELLKHGGKILWEKGLDDYIRMRTEGYTRRDEIKQLRERIKEDEIAARKLLFPLKGAGLMLLGFALGAAYKAPDHISRYAGPAIIGSIGYLGALATEGSLQAWKKVLKQYALENFKYHVEKAQPEEVVKTYLALKAVRKEEIPGTIASKIRKIYMDAMREAIEEHLENLNTKK